MKKSQRPIINFGKSKSKTQNSAITLTELIVSVALIFIVSFGVISINTSLQQMESTSSKSILVAMRTIPLMTLIRYDANKATGDAQNNGIVAFDGSGIFGGINLFAVRQDLNANTFGVYGDDTWILYVHNKAAKTLRKCSIPDDNIPGISPLQFEVLAATTLPSCSSDATTVIADNIVGSSFTFNINPNWNPLDATSLKVYFKVYLKALYDPTLPENIITNPSYELESSFSPVSHSW